MSEMDKRKVKKSLNLNLLECKLLVVVEVYCIIIIMIKIYCLGVSAIILVRKGSFQLNRVMFRICSVHPRSRSRYEGQAQVSFGRTLGLKSLQSYVP